MVLVFYFFCWCSCIFYWIFDLLVSLNIKIFLIIAETSERDSDTSSVVSSEGGSSECGSNNTTSKVQRSDKSQKYLLDLYSGCGAMSTGLCMGASLSGVKLVTVS